MPIYEYECSNCRYKIEYGFNKFFLSDNLLNVANVQGGSPASDIMAENET